MRQSGHRAWLRPRRLLSLLGTALCALAITSSDVPITNAARALAATPGWGVVFSTHYGVAADYSGYTTVIAPGPSDAWAFGANDLSRGSSADPQAPVAVHWTGTAWQASSLPAGVTSEIIA